MTLTSFLVETHDRVEVVTINRPGAANAIDRQAAGELSAVLDEAEGAEGVEAVVLTGSGSTFCAGADLRGISRGELALAEGREVHGFAGFVRRRLNLPVIAALNGGALGGGTELALACDAVVATSSAFLCLPELIHGLLPAGGGLVRLGRTLPPQIATEFILTGRRMSAEEAKKWGLVNVLAEPEALLDMAIAMARSLTVGRSQAVAAALRLLRQIRAEDTPWDLVSEEADLLRRSVAVGAAIDMFFAPSQPGDETSD